MRTIEKRGKPLYRSSCIIYTVECAKVRTQTRNELHSLLHRVRMLNVALCRLQKQEFNEERKKSLSDAAKRLYRDEPDLLKAANEEYDSE